MGFKNHKCDLSDPIKDWLAFGLLTPPESPIWVWFSWLLLLVESRSKFFPLFGRLSFFFTTLLLCVGIPNFPRMSPFMKPIEKNMSHPLDSQGKIPFSRRSFYLKPAAIYVEKVPSEPTFYDGQPVAIFRSCCDQRSSQYLEFDLHNLHISI